MPVVASISNNKFTYSNDERDDFFLNGATKIITFKPSKPYMFGTVLLTKRHGRMPNIRYTDQQEAGKPTCDLFFQQDEVPPHYVALGQAI